ncbi:hypothetical protein Pelo_11155 [Pelomyxa schiedti]|nr:hypothetical protein Pelo_11155 [Pelomyxa schiedti]
MYCIDVFFRSYILSGVPIGQGGSGTIFAAFSVHRNKWMDFGHCRTLDASGTAQSRVGTPIYMAPEVHGINVTNRTYGTPADVWSSGVVLYSMAAFAFPFAGGNFEALIRSGRYNEGPLGPVGVHMKVKDLLRRMLTVNPDMRIKIEGTKCTQGILDHPWMIEQGSADKSMWG